MIKKIVNWIVLYILCTGFCTRTWHKPEYPLQMCILSCGTQKKKILSYFLNLYLFFMLSLFLYYINILIFLSPIWIISSQVLYAIRIALFYIMILLVCYYSASSWHSHNCPCFIYKLETIVLVSSSLHKIFW